MDTEKQVVSPEVQSGADNAPMVLEEGRRAGMIQAQHEADKEVTSSWQTQSVGENAPIPTSSEIEEPRPGAVELESPVMQVPQSPSQKQPPPPYESLEREQSATSADLSTPLAPDATPDTLPPRPEDTSAVAQLLSWLPDNRTPRSPTRTAALVKPVVIPQLDVPPVGESVPFQRCYSDVLAEYDVPMQEFVAFLDGLAIAQAPNSTLQGLKVFGSGLSFVPILGLAGKGISTLANLGSGHSSSRVKLYLSRTMQEYFAPRGLRIRIAKDSELGTHFLRLPPNAPRLAPLTQETMADSICTRRVNAIRPYAAELRFDVPAESADAKVVDKLAKKNLSYQFNKNAKEVARMREEQFRGRGFEGAVEEEKKCARLRWLVIEEFR